MNKSILTAAMGAAFALNASAAGILLVAPDTRAEDSRTMGGAYPTAPADARAMGAAGNPTSTDTRADTARTPASSYIMAAPEGRRMRAASIQLASPDTRVEDFTTTLTGSSPRGSAEAR